MPRQIIVGTLRQRRRMPRSYGTYGWSRARRTWRVYADPWEVRSKSPSYNVVVTCLRTLYGFIVCYLATWSQNLKGCVRAPYEPLWIAGAWVYTYGQSCMAVRAPVSASTGYICQSNLMCHLTCTGTRTGIGRATQDCLRDFYGHKIIASPCLKVMHAQLQPVQVQNVQKIVWARKACGFSRFWPLRHP